MSVSPAIIKHLLSRLSPTDIKSFLEEAMHIQNITAPKIAKMSKNKGKGSAAISAVKFSRPLNSWMAYRSKQSQRADSS